MVAAFSFGARVEGRLAGGPCLRCCLRFSKTETGVETFRSKTKVFSPLWSPFLKSGDIGGDIGGDIRLPVAFARSAIRNSLKQSPVCRLVTDLVFFDRGDLKPCPYLLRL